MFESLVSFEGWKPPSFDIMSASAFESLVSFEGWKPCFCQNPIYP